MTIDFTIFKENEITSLLCDVLKDFIFSRKLRMSGLEWIKIMSIFVLMFPVIGAQFLAATHFLRFDSQ